MSKLPITIHDYAFFRDGIVKSEDANINIMTHGFMYGTAVFEGIRAYYNKEENKLYALHVEEHLERLLRSCKIMRMKPKYSLEEMRKFISELLQKNCPQTDAYVRPSYFKDSLRIGPNLIGDTEEDSLCISTISLGDYLNTEKGIKVTVSSWRRLSDNAIPARAKVNGSYVNTAMAKADAFLSGYDEAIFLTEAGDVAEGSAMNLFIIRDGKLVTSQITDNILEGITRNFVIELAKNELGLEVEARSIDRTELYVADEAFFCGTGAQIVPIGSIDNYELGNTKPGEITKKLQSLYNDICRGKVEKYKKYLLEIDLAKTPA